MCARWASSRASSRAASCGALSPAATGTRSWCCRASWPVTLYDGAAAPLPALARLRRARLEARRQPGSQRRAARGAGRAPHAARRAARAPCQPDRLEPGGHLRARAGARAPGPRAPRDHARDTLSRHLGHARRAADPPRRAVAGRRGPTPGRPAAPAAAPRHLHLQPNGRDRPLAGMPRAGGTAERERRGALQPHRHGIPRRHARDHRRPPGAGRGRVAPLPGSAGLVPEMRRRP